MKKIVFVLILVGMMFSGGCVSEKNKPTINFEENEIVIEKGKTKEFDPGEGIRIVFSEEGIVTYDEDKKELTGIAEGSLTITLISDKDESVTKAVKVTVKGDDKKTYTVTLDPDGGICEVQSIKFESPGAALPVPSKEGFIFKGWYEGETKIEATKELRDYNLKAKWEEITHKITYDLDGGENAEGNPSSFKKSDLPIALGTPSKEGFIFKGWYEGETKIEATKELRDYNLKAKWEEAKEEKPQEIAIEYDKKDFYYLDDEIVFSAVILPACADQTVTWRVSPRASAQLDENNRLIITKGGTYEITAKSSADKNITASVKVTIKDYIDPKKFMDGLQVKNVTAKEVYLYQGQKTNPTTKLLGGVCYYMFEELHVIDNPVKEGQSNRPGTVSGSGIKFKLRYVTVHDVGWVGESKVTSDNCCRENERNTSWHFSVGNEGVYQQLPLDEIGYHAGDGTTVEHTFVDTGIKAPAGSDTPAVITINQTTGNFEVNGTETNIKAPTAPDGRTVRNDEIVYTGINNYVDPETGTYMIGNTHWSYNALANYGGNLNSIGIETCIMADSNLYYTWCLTAKTIAEKILRPEGLLPRDVKQHNTFSGKDCPQTMRKAGMWEEFMKCVNGEYEMLRNFSPNLWTINFETSSEYLKPNGLIDHLPEEETIAEYTITMKNKQNEEYSFDYKVLLPAKKDIKRDAEKKG